MRGVSATGVLGEREGEETEDPGRKEGAASEVYLDTETGWEGRSPPGKSARGTPRVTAGLCYGVRPTRLMYQVSPQPPGDHGQVLLTF